MQDSGFDSDAGSFINCSNLDEQSIRLLALMRGLTGIVCFLVCLATLLLVLSRRCLASLRESTQARLMAYLLLSTVAYLLVLSMHLEHYWTNSGSGNHTARRAYWEVDLCVAIGMADQYTGTVQLFFTAGVATYFIYRFLTLFHKKSYTPNLHLNQTQSKQSVARRRGLEVLLVMVSLLVPALYVWVPFSAVPYGETGPWCWIRSLGRDCRRLKGAFWEQMGIWYIPFGMAAFFSFAAITLFLVGLCRYFPHLKNRKGQKRGETCVLIAFLSTYCLLFLIECVSHIIDDKVHRDYLSLWMLYAISTPLSGVTLPVGLLIFTHTGTLRDTATQYCHCRCIRHRKLFISLFRNPSSFTCDPTFLRTSDDCHMSPQHRMIESMHIQASIPVLVELEHSCETTPLCNKQGP